MPATSCSTGRDPIRRVRFERTAGQPLQLQVVIDLAEHVASCCVNPDTAFVEFQGPGGHVHAGFEFRESRPGHQFVARATLPVAGPYAYRIVAPILGVPFTREGTYDA